MCEGAYRLSVAALPHLVFQFAFGLHLQQLIQDFRFRRCGNVLGAHKNRRPEEYRNEQDASIKRKIAHKHPSRLVFPGETLIQLPMAKNLAPGRFGRAGPGAENLYLRKVARQPGEVRSQRSPAIEVSNRKIAS